MSAALRGLALALVVCSCANAGNPGTGGGDDAPKIDASTGHKDANFIPTDAPPADAPADSSVMVDAMVDAPSGPFCSSNAECTNAGECCFNFGSGMGFCTPGSVVLGQCLPSQ